MRRNFMGFKYIALSSAIGLLSHASYAKAAAEGAADEGGGEVCIPPNVVQRVTSCPKGIKLDKRSRAEVGTSTKKEEPKKKKMDLV